ncbi:hypothetical protein [Janthinobacterium tructae]|uniref:hypothetical protein n=1 Tax=Janthinobacterium tructae TaxID=2590869 RepID=UPI002499E021|nr:hypothetical protein [Janthinobacterium tructae]MDI3292318.1 hypothetical protein [Janthinobacterium tructae]
MFEVISEFQCLATLGGQRGESLFRGLSSDGGHFPVMRDILHGQPNEFRFRLVVREVAAFPDHLA